MSKQFEICPTCILKQKALDEAEAKVAELEKEIPDKEAWGLHYVEEIQTLTEVLWRCKSALRAVMDNIGVPQPEYPANITHAYHIAKEAYRQEYKRELSIKKLERKLATAREALEAVQQLMNGSYGVIGLHLNGDVAPWHSLLKGGQFEEWLIKFSEWEAEQALKEVGK